MQVKVHVLKARNLTAADSDGTSDPYAVVLVGDDEAGSQTSKTVSSTLAPEWGESFSFAGAAADDSVTVRVFDYDYVGRDDPIGELRVSLRDAARQYVAYGAEGRWHRLTGEDAGEGEVYLGFEVDPVPDEARSRNALPALSDRGVDAAGERVPGRPAHGRCAGQPIVECHGTRVAQNAERRRHSRYARG